MSGGLKLDAFDYDIVSDSIKGLTEYITMNL